MAEASISIKVESLREGAPEGYPWWKIINDKYMIFHNWESEEGALRLGETISFVPMLFPIYRNCPYTFISKVHRAVAEVSA